MTAARRSNLRARAAGYPVPLLTSTTARAFRVEGAATRNRSDVDHAALRPDPCAMLQSRQKRCGRDRPRSPSSRIRHKVIRLAQIAASRYWLRN